MEESKNGSNDLIKSSFFDDLKDCKPYEYNLWLDNPQFRSVIENYCHISDDLMLEGHLINKCKKKEEIKTKYYKLYKDRLDCYKVSLLLIKTKDSQFPHKHMILKGTKLETLDNSQDELLKATFQRFCLIFSHNKKYYILYPTDEDFFKKWIEKLKGNCVQSSYNKLFTNIKIIGKGTFAKVILAKRNSTGETFAVKTFDKKGLLYSKTPNRTKIALQNEINMMRILSHPNLIQLYEVFEGEGHIYLVMDQLKGGELFDRILKKGHYSEKDAAACLTQLLRGLEYLHELGIMHRDIKPENLILRDEAGYELVLVDFGLGEFVNNKEYLFKRCGTPGYVAPEVLDDKIYSTKADVFSAGVILYILLKLFSFSLTGCSPFFGKSYGEILKKNKEGSVNYNFEEINITISKDGFIILILAMDLLRSMLEKDPEKRISAVEALEHHWIKQYMNFTNMVSPQVKARTLKPSQIQENLKALLMNQNLTRNQKPDNFVMNTPLINGRSNEIMESPLNFGRSPMIDSPNKRRCDKLLKPIFEKPVNKHLPQTNIINEEEERKEADNIPKQDIKKTEGVRNMLKKMEI